MNLKKKIMFGIVSILSIIPMISTRAITKEELAKTLAPNNKVESTTVKPNKTSDLAYYSSIYFSNKFGYNAYITLENCNSDYSICNIKYKDYNKQEEIIIEAVEVTWQKPKLNKTEIQKTFAPNNKVESTTVKPNNLGDLYNFSSTHFRNKFNKHDAYITLDDCNKDYSICNIKYTDNNTHEEVITEKVEVTWQEPKLNKNEIQKTLAPNSKVESTTIKPNDISNLFDYSNSYFNSKFKYDAYITLENCNEDYSICNIKYIDNNTCEKVIIEAVEVTWQEPKLNKIEIQKTLAPNNKVNMPTVKPYQTYELSSFSDTYFNNNFNYNAYITLENCNSDYSICNIKYKDYNTQEEIIIEAVEVTWQSSKLNKSDIEKKYLTNGTLKLNSVRPKNRKELYAYESAVLGRLHRLLSGFSNCNSDYSVCDLIYTDAKTMEKVTLEQVKIEWQEPNANAEKIIKENIASIKKYFDSNNNLKLEDLQAIKIYNSTNENIDITKAIDISLLDKKISFVIGGGAGYGVNSEFSIVLDGQLVIAYDNIFYNIQDDNVYYLPINNIIYIPDDTKDTDEAYIKAAYDRLKQIDKNITIEVAGKISDVATAYNSLITKEDLKNNYYRIKNDNFNRLFIIRKDSSKMQTIDSTGEIEESAKEIGKDETTGVTIDTTSKEVPNDAKIIVKIIEKTDDIFKKIINKIKAKVEEVMVIDLKVYSESENKYISKISDGEFIVSIPIIDKLKNKDLVAYYIKDNGDIEEHPVTVKNGIATFKTTHFSTYTLAEKKIETVPPTYDGIIKYIIMLVIGIVGICATSLLQKNKEIKR